MSDSSSEEDLSRFKDVVDTSFTRALVVTKIGKIERNKQKSERYLDEATHYNDVKVPEEMQKRIGAKLSAIIQKKYEFTEVRSSETELTSEVNGGIKLFKDSSGFLSCDNEKDVSTEIHNNASRKHKKRIRDRDDNGLNKQEKVESVVISGDYVLSKLETKHWKSRRKEKIFKYKASKGNKVLISAE